MDSTQSNCPLTAGQTLQRYFIENRSRLLDIAAYLDRIERSKNPDHIIEDSRFVSFKKAIEVLLNNKNNRVEKIQEILSDLTMEPKEFRK